ncbi:hypothetical protein [Streptomyces sp. BpilaLS-43]|uniref:hypothetical protein n=1 Tax=Streptomyces sp. BpilaLS-43 TaxID=1839778 RepID=UPI00159F3269|nr:hypothetical protein [Streptomyces sp. BpilaLS-43]
MTVYQCKELARLQDLEMVGVDKTAEAKTVEARKYDAEACPGPRRDTLRELPTK